MQQITSHVPDALDKLLSQYKGLPNITSLFSVFALGVQKIENAIFAQYLATPLSTAVGAQLDNIGGIVGVQRNNLDDATYAVLIRGQIALNNSNATTDALLNLINLVWQPAGIFIVDLNTDTANKLATPAVLSLGIVDPAIPLSLKTTLLSILNKAVGGGVMLSQVDIYTAKGNKTFAFAGPDAHIAGFGAGTFCQPFFVNSLD